jgi:hypothetical protein
MIVDAIQRIYDSGWDPRAESNGSKSEQVRQCMDLQHCLHWLHLEPLSITHLVDENCLLMQPSSAVIPHKSLLRAIELQRHLHKALFGEGLVGGA